MTRWCAGRCIGCCDRTRGHTGKASHFGRRSRSFAGRPAVQPGRTPAILARTSLLSRARTSPGSPVQPVCDRSRGHTGKAPHFGRLAGYARGCRVSGKGERPGYARRCAALEPHTAPFAGTRARRRGGLWGGRNGRTGVRAGRRRGRCGAPVPRGVERSRGSSKPNAGAATEVGGIPARPPTAVASPGASGTRLGPLRQSVKAAAITPTPASITAQVAPAWKGWPLVKRIGIAVPSIFFAARQMTPEPTR
jgi:hypothetical protein